MRHTTLLLFLFWSAVLLGCGQPSPDGDSDPAASPDEAASASSPAEDAGDAPASDRPAGEAPQGDVTANADSPESGADAERPQPIRTAEQLSRALTERNPEFEGPVEWQALSPQLVAVSIHDPNLKDIGPLGRVPLGALDISGCDVTDLKPLAGLQLFSLYAEQNRRLIDIEPLRGMPLREIYLSDTRVENLGPLRGAPLTKVNLVGTRVKDVSPLSESPIDTVWLSHCPVDDISPLKETPLVSLTVENTPVHDISPLEGHPVQRLHIGRAAVSDLTPLRNMRLTRLVFTPSRIKKGIEFARGMPSLTELGTTFKTRMPPRVFWQMYDSGKLE